MTETPRVDPFFVADHRALDLLNSVCAPWGKEIEWIENGDDLLDWMQKAELLTYNQVKDLKHNLLPETLNSAASKARDLREWFRGFVSTYAGKKLDNSALKELGLLNKLLEKNVKTLCIEPGDEEPELQWLRTKKMQSSDDLLFPLAEEIADFICNVDLTLVKNCEGPTCPLWFLDITKNTTRRWCSMSVCGNRAKAAAHRARKKQSQTATTE